MVKGNSTGRVKVIKSFMGSVLVRDKKEGKSDIVVDGVPVTRSIYYTSDDSSI